MLKRIVFLFLVCSCSLSATAQQHYEQLFTQASQYYDAGKYDSALTLYHKIEGANYASFPLYYNMGNAYFKANNMSAAILYYERARKIAPNNSDVNHNLELANSQITDEIEEIPDFFLEKWWQYFYGMFTATTWGYLCVLLTVLISIAVGFYFKMARPQLRRLFFMLSVVLLCVFCLVLTAGFSKYQLETDKSHAIVVKPSLTVKSEPSVNATELFLLHEGTKVQVLEKSEEWQKISLADGNVGWVRKETLQII